MVNSDTKGKRKILISNKEGQIIFSKEVLIEIGISRIQLDASLNPGIQYRMYTDESFNVQQLGFKSPRLVRTFNNTNYPYVIDNVLTIGASTFGAIYYYYFYDWEVHYDHVECQSEIRDVIAFVEKPSAIGDILLDHSEFKIYPSPALDKIFLKFPDQLSVKVIQINDANGKQHLSVLSKATEIDVSHLNPGVYFITILSDKKIITEKFIKH
jgi:hypothetical protein